MKLSKQYEGKRYTIYAIVCNDGSCPAIEYLENVEKDNPSSYKSLINIIKRHAENSPILNERKSRSIEGKKNLYEFKSTQGDRILYFYQLNRITVLTNGFHKGTPVEIEFQKAIRLRDAYLSEVQYE
ncbi:type II toxin-antitoxin system RelE/ParE family toxin [Chloroflexota bacterium]